MDWLDKKIISRLMENCRESYHNIARVFNVTCPTITYRVNRLRQLGVIQRFIAEISQETLGVDWILAELQTSNGVDRSSLFQAFESNACIGNVLVLGGGRYIVLAEVYPDEQQDFVACLKKIDEIEYIEISNIQPIANGSGIGSCKFTTRGEKIQLTRIEIEILRYLTTNARIPIKTISDNTGLNQKLIRRLVRQFSEFNGVHLTLKLNLSQCGRINFILRTRLSDMSVDPNEVTQWIACRYPQEHWFTFFSPRTDSLLHYMTVGQPSDIESMLQEALQHSQIDEVDASIIYSTFRSEGRTRQFLMKCAGDISEEEWEVAISSGQEAEISY